LKQALEALEYAADEVYCEANDDAIGTAIAAIRAHLDNTKDVEPVAWMGEYNINDIRDHYTVVMRHRESFDGHPDRIRPLYLHPAPIPPGMVEELTQERDKWESLKVSVALAAIERDQAIEQLATMTQEREEQKRAADHWFSEANKDHNELVKCQAREVALREVIAAYYEIMLKMKRYAEQLRKEAECRGHCMCDECKDGVIHDACCAVHNEPAYPKQPCDCGAKK
jgi:hypothetical protein